MKVPVAVDGVQLVVNAFCPSGPVIVRLRWVSGTSGTLLIVTARAVKLTSPTTVIANGGGNDTVTVGLVPEPASLTVPVSFVGASGEVAVAVPITQPAPVPVRHLASAARLTPTPLGSLSTIVLLAASLAACVISSLRVAPLSLASLASETASVGAYGSPLQPVTVSGAEAMAEMPA